MPQSLAHIALIVCDYDEAIAWFTDKLGFTLVEDTYQPEQDKRWVLVAPPAASEDAATLLLARAATPEQAAFIGNQAGGSFYGTVAPKWMIMALQWGSNSDTLTIPPVGGHHEAQNAHLIRLRLSLDSLSAGRCGTIGGKLHS